MTFDLSKILQSKRTFRRRVASLPIEEKLAMLDALRERTLALRESQSGTAGGAMREESPVYRAKRKSGQ
ncbi:MAG TPA: hypothetical protein PKA41_02005 [Verrucomicrobiota bacterium]|nr:hypothetical protein [Verrucomicrobiota bacterium]